MYTCRPTHLLSFAAALTALGLAGTAPGQIQFTGLGTGTWIATDVSNDGSTVVGLRTANPEGAFRWTSSTGAVGLGTLPGAVSSYASGVSADGSIAVGFSNFSTHYEPVRWTLDTGGVSLGKPEGAEWTTVNAVSGDGARVVGGSYFSTTSYQATVWTAGKGPELLEALPGADITEASNISADGRIIVGSSRAALRVGRAVRWIDGRIDEIDAREGGGSIGLGVSSAGTYIVGSFSPANSNDEEAFLWSESTGMMGLNPAQGPRVTQARGVTEDGQLVIGFGGGGFLWTPESGARDLLEVLKNEYGLLEDMEDWGGLMPFSMSPDGRYIVGAGYHGTEREAWLLDRGLDPPPLGEAPPIVPVPEATTYGLLAVAGLGAVVWRRRRTHSAARPDLG